ncbi:uncharacterized protein LOC108664723 [Hyalella azteca]|uniref:Uncharacterized protein LOC108664723 n=1 Tax=Hyalella azteca TaxID=294128 RepID=A0A8B7MZA0_HYAAZ|nr:uncharacterized protein LOC108664723 [Hyalella azteca]
MSDKQLAMYNRLLCAANASLINTLSPERVGNALVSLGITLEGCSRDDVLAPLASKASTYYPSVLSRAQVRELGVVFAGLDSSKIRRLDPTSFAGLSRIALRAMSNDSILAMSSSQLDNLPMGASMAVYERFGRDFDWGRIPAANTTINNNTEINSNLTFNENSNVNYKLTNNITNVNSNLTVHGNTNVNFNFTVNGNTTATGAEAYTDEACHPLLDS